MGSQGVTPSKRSTLQQPFQCRGCQAHLPKPQAPDSRVQPFCPQATYSRADEHRQRSPTVDRVSGQTCALLSVLSDNPHLGLRPLSYKCRFQRESFFKKTRHTRHDSVSSRSDPFRFLWPTGARFAATPSCTYSPGQRRKEAHGKLRKGGVRAEGVLVGSWHQHANSWLFSPTRVLPLSHEQALCSMMVPCRGPRTADRHDPGTDWEQRPRGGRSIKR